MLSFVAVIYATYAYTYKLENRTKLSKKLSTMMMSEAELKALEELEYEREAAEFDNDDDF
jgi:hypothetical protein